MKSQKIRIIFTDIDGVLMPIQKNEWNKNSIDLYVKLCKTYNLLPVITSSWRLSHTQKELQTIFYENGIDVIIHDFTSSDNKLKRGEQIIEWIKSNNCEEWVILDDNISDISPFIKNTIKCRSWIGLSEEEFLEISNIFDAH